MKNLIYFTAGVQPDFIKLTRFCIHTIIRNSDLSNIDILIMCDEKYSEIVKAELPFAKVFITESNLDNMTTSMRKMEIFSVPNIEQYTKILYLDSDIIVMKNIAKIFEHNLEDDILYVKQEGDTSSFGSSLFHGLLAYTAEELAHFEQNNVKPFSAGHFLFRNTNEMKIHFQSILDLIKSWTGNYFYEQSFLNHHFQRNQKYDNSLLDGMIEIACTDEVGKELYKNKDTTILHFANFSAPTHYKFHNMRMAFTLHNFAFATQLDNRNCLSEVIKLPKNARIAEIGVLQGEFSRSLIKQFRPYSIYLIDPFEGVVPSGDPNGNNVQIYNMEEEYQKLSKKYADKKRVVVLKTKSTILETFPDDFFDLIYIDGDHSFEGVTYDLEISHKKVKHNGWICGHDLAMNAAKTSNTYDFGVKDALYRFCYLNELHHVKYKFMDGCVSYAIQNKKWLDTI